MRSIARYPEVREDGSMWVPVAPPPAPTYWQLSPQDTGVVGQRAVLSYSTEWLMDLRVFTDPCEEHGSGSRWVTQLCDEGAWYDFERNQIAPKPTELVVASVRLVFLLGPRVGTSLRRGKTPL